MQWSCGAAKFSLVSLKAQDRKKTFRQGVRSLLFIAMTYPFGATKTDLEKAFRLPAASSQANQEPEPLDLSESEQATVLFEHPDI